MNTVSYTHLKKVPLLALHKEHLRLDPWCVRNQVSIGIPMALSLIHIYIDLAEQYRICREKIKNSETDMQLFTNIQGFVGPCGGIGHLQLVIENWADDYSNLDGISEDLLPLMRKISDAYANDTSVAAYEKIEKSFQKAWEKVQAYYEEQGTVSYTHLHHG